MENDGDTELSDMVGETVRPINMSRFKQADAYVPIPPDWTCLGQRSVLSNKDKKPYTLVEYAETGGLIIGLFITDLGEDGLTGETIVKASALKRAVERAQAYGKSR